MKKVRFSKQVVLEQLDRWCARIAIDQKFNLGDGTSQLRGRRQDADVEALLLRAVEYGKLRGLERFGEMVEEGFDLADKLDDARPEDAAPLSSAAEAATDRLDELERLRASVSAFLAAHDDPEFHNLGLTKAHARHEDALNALRQIAGAKGA